MQKFNIQHLVHRNAIYPDNAGYVSLEDDILPRVDVELL
jgi:hypothetical protein